MTPSRKSAGLEIVVQSYFDPVVTVPKYLAQRFRRTWRFLRQDTGFSRRTLFIVSLGLGVPIVVVVASAIAVAARTAAVGRLVAASQVLVGLLISEALLATYFLFAVPRANDREGSLPHSNVRQFRVSWRSVWLAWTLLYLGLALQELIKSERAIDWFGEDTVRVVGAYLPAVVNLLNNFQTVGLLMCYIVISRAAVDTKKRAAELPWWPMLVSIGILAVLECVAARFGPVFTWISGIAAGASIALLVGRMDNQVFRMPPFVVWLLYVYAVIQPGWVAFDNAELKFFLVTAAMLLKTVLFAVTAWLMTSGVLREYLEITTFTTRMDRTVLLTRVRRAVVDESEGSNEGVA